MAGAATSPSSWSFATAQTNQVLVAIGATERALVSYTEIAVASTVTVDAVSVYIGFATTTLAAPTEDSLTPVTGLFFNHTGVARGGGAVSTGTFIGGLGEDVRIVSTQAPGGGFGLVMNVRILTDQDTL
jgi:hypothetical protein